MAQVKNLIAKWGAAWPSPMIISRQYDNGQYRIDLFNYPEAEHIVDEQTEQMEVLSYYLIVWMKETEDGEPREMSPIMLPGPYWIVPNYYTQLVQDIRFQFCVQSDSTDYEAHSAIFTGRIVDSIEHDGDPVDVTPAEMFDAYKAYVNDLIVAAGAVVIDPNLDTAGAAADAKAVGDALSSTNGRLTQQGEDITELQSGGYVADQQQIEAKINAWLNDHPDATTTVQDGSLTEAKFSDTLKLKAVKDYITPQMYGAKGDGVTDDTQAIQNCIDDCYANGIYRIFFPRGVYLVTSPIVIYFSYNQFWYGKGITLEGEHKGDTIIKKTGTAKYKDIDTVIFCDTGESGYTDGTGCIVKNFTLKNESDAEYAYCINGLNYSRGQFKNLTVTGKYGIFCEGGYSNIFDDIIGNTSKTFFRDGGTSTHVGKIGCFGAENPYILRATYATYDLLFGDRCTGVFCNVSPYGSCHISTIGTESPNLDCVVQSGENPQFAQSKAITIDNIFCFNLVSESPKYLIIKDARLRVGALTIQYQRTPVAATICYFDSTYGSCDIGEIGHFTNAASYDKSLVTLSDNMGTRNHLHISNTEFSGFYRDSMVTLGGDPSFLGIGESTLKNKFQSIVMGGYFRHANFGGAYFRPDGSEMRYAVMPPKGSLILNDLTNENCNIGAAGFISLATADNEQYGNLINNKAPIPIMYCTTEENVPSAALKNGTLLFNTSTSKLEVYYNNAWVVIGS